MKFPLGDLIGSARAATRGAGRLKNTRKAGWRGQVARVFRRRG
jgi:hypothetical protein